MKNRNKYYLLPAATMLLAACLTACDNKAENEPEQVVDQDIAGVIEGTDTDSYEPVTKWGCSADYVKQNQMQGSLIDEQVTTDRFGDEQRVLLYEAQDQGLTVRYQLDRDRLTCASVMIQEGQGYRVRVYMPSADRKSTVILTNYKE